MEILEKEYESRSNLAIFASVTMEDIRVTSEQIRTQSFKLHPLFRIYFQPGVVGKDMCYKGVPVYPISSYPPIDIDIYFEYETVFMDPMDRLVLSSLGFFLLKANYPEYREDHEMYIKKLSSRTRVNRLHILSLRRALLNESKGETLKEITSVLLHKSPCPYVFTLLFHYLYMPYFNCINENECILPPFFYRKGILPREGSPLFYSSRKLYPVRFIYDFILKIYLEKVMLELQTSIPGILNKEGVYTYFYYFIVEEEGDSTPLLDYINSFMDKTKKMGIEIERVTLRRGIFGDNGDMHVALFEDGTIRARFKGW